MKSNLTNKYYLIRSKEKRQFRVLLRNLNDKVQKSSLYILDDYLYLLIKTNHIIKSISSNTKIFINSASDSALNLLEKELFAWAKSEIDQTIDFLSYESQSILVKNGRALIKHNKTIIRSFSYLADIFAIVNMTPDSFSDAGKYNQIDKALIRIVEHINNGASIIDVGLESTRPGAKSPIIEEEISRLQLILKEVIALKQQYKFLISLDSYHAKTIAHFCDWDIDIINDVSGNLPRALVKECINNNKKYLAMHSLSIPASKDILLDIDINPINYIYEWMQKKINDLEKLGIPLEQIIIDPGIGFGNSPVQGWFIINHLNKLKSLPVELLLGFSRKSLFSHITNIAPAERDLVTMITVAKIINDIDYLRLHELKDLSVIYSVMNELRFN